MTLFSKIMLFISGFITLFLIINFFVFSHFIFLYLVIIIFFLLSIYFFFFFFKLALNYSNSGYKIVKKFISIVEDKETKIIKNNRYKEILWLWFQVILLIIIFIIWIDIFNISIIYLILISILIFFFLSYKNIGFIRYNIVYYILWYKTITLKNGENLYFIIMKKKINIKNKKELINLDKFDILNLDDNIYFLK